MTTRGAFAFALTLTLLALIAAPAQAQGPAHAEGYVEGEGGWKFGLAPYLWAVGIDGTVVVNGVPSEVDVGFDELFDQVDFAAELHFEAIKDNKWGVLIDPTYVKASIDSQVGPLPAKVELKYVLTDFAFTRQVAKNWQVLAGARYTTMENTIQITGLPAVTADKSWTDLIVGGRFITKLSEIWVFTARADIGGFGIGSSSEFTWNTSALFFRNWRNTSLIVGYRVLDVDFEDGAGPTLFKFDVRQDGPILGVGFRWPRR